MDNSSPLHGLRVIDMTEALAGPYCAMMLGDLGADVIKVERTVTGDQSRSWGPPFLDGESAYYLCVNRNKRSIALDIKAPDELELLRALIGTADVFLTNNPSMSSLRRAGLDPDSLRGLNERLVYAAISGYGHTGPKAGRAGYDIIAQAEAGLMALTGDPDGEPYRFPAAMADISGGIYAMIGVLAALYQRDTDRSGSGKGQFIDVALLDAQSSWLSNIAGNYFATGQRPKRLGNEHPTITPYQPMHAKDKSLIIAIGTDRLWQKFCRALDVESTLMTDARFADNASRNRHRRELITALDSLLRQKPAAEWIDLFVDAGIPAGPINFPDEALTDAQILARGMIVELEHPAIGIVRSLGFPARMSETGPSYRRPPPRLDEHGTEIRRELEKLCGRGFSVPKRPEDTP